MNGTRESGKGAWFLIVAGLLLSIAGCGRYPAAPEKDLAMKARVTAETARSEAVKRAANADSNFLDQMQGRWVGENESTRWEWTIRGDALQAKTSEGDYYKGTMVVRPQTNPIQVDFKMSDCSDTGLNDRTIEGIMKLEGKKMTFCVARPEDPGRPKDFDRSQGLMLSAVKQ